MGYVSNQWLNKGQGLRTRKYRPVQVTVRAIVPDDEWSRKRGVRIEFCARQDNGQYQTLHLDGGEAESAAVAIATCCDTEGRRKAAQALLTELSDADLLDVLGAALRKRSRAGAGH